MDFLLTPVGLGLLVALVAAAGLAGPGIKQGLQGAAEFLRARWNGRHKQADQPSERTDDWRMDLAALAAAPPTTREVMVVREGLAALEQRITGKGGVQERVAILEDTCARTESKVDALPGKVDEQLKAQTIEIRTHLSQEVFRAVRGLHDELAEETDAKIAAAMAKQLGVSEG